MFGKLPPVVETPTVFLKLIFYIGLGMLAVIFTIVGCFEYVV